MRTPALVRGQTLVLFALTLLLTTLLVLMTLSITTRVKEKMELQAVADAAAYSNAVVEARTYNEIALLTRGQIGKEVSQAAVQSLISWSAYYRAQIEATRVSYEKSKMTYQALLPCCAPNSGCTQFCSCAQKAIQDIDQTRGELSQYHQQVKANWHELDIAAGEHTQKLTQSAVELYMAQKDLYTQLEKKLKGQALTQEIVQKAKAGSRWPDEWSAPEAADEVSVSEALGEAKGSKKGGAITEGPSLEALGWHVLNAAMGSRGFTFITKRTGGADVISEKLQEQLPQQDSIKATNLGSGYYTSGAYNHGQLMPGTAYSVADDHGDGAANTVTFGRGEAPCPQTSVGDSSATAQVRSTDIDDKNDEHVWSPGGEPEDFQRHTLGKCVLGCPGIWPLFVDYNSKHLESEANNWGQPKNHAVIQRDYSKRLGSPDPWALSFRYDFSGKGDPTSRFDNRGVRLGPRSGGLDISKQTALSTGIAYYHRHGHWRETPNLLNPYWRATLVPFDVDQDGPNDVKKTLEAAGVAWAADAFQALRNQGYKGGP